MKRQPPRHQQPVAGAYGPRPAAGDVRTDVATDRGGIIEPFLAGGAAVEFLHNDDEENPLFAPEANGVQAVAAFHVPKGYTGFLKELMCVPFGPPQLLARNVPTNWPGFANTPPFTGERAIPLLGYYETPCGWESQFDPTVEGGAIPIWNWHLRLIPGNPFAGRPPFNVLDAATWAYQLDVAVPASVYPQGLPGSSPWPAQRLQVPPWQGFETHVPIPDDTTVSLWATWTQVLFQPAVIVAAGTVYTPYGPTVYPLLPSAGRLHGYIQSAARQETVANAKQGW